MEAFEETSVLVIGGGMAGLTAACDLHERHVDVIVLEAATRLGGRVESVTTSLGSRIDIGGQWVGFGHHRLELLAAQAQSKIYKSYTKGLPVLIHDNRRLSLFSPGVILGVIILVFFDLLCRIGVPEKWNSVSIKEAISAVAPLKITRKFLEVLSTLSSTAELANVSIYALADAVPLSGGLNTMLGTAGGAQDALIVQSIGSVVDMLSARLGPSRVRTGMCVIEVDQTHGGVRVRTASGKEFRAAKIIITVPPPMLRSISFKPSLPSNLSKLQANTRMGTVYKAIAVFDKPFWREKFGGECIILDDPPRGVFDSSSPGGPGHLCILVGGAPARLLDEMSYKARLNLLLAPLVKIVGQRVLEPLEWHEKAWHQDEFCGGGYTAVPAIGSLEGLLPMPHEPVDNIHWAGTETAQDHPGYIEGAIQSGQRAATEVATAMRFAASTTL